MSSVLNLLEEFKVLSTAMLQAAGDQSWDLLEQLSGERETIQAQLPAALEAHLLPVEIDSAMSLIAACLTLDKQTFALADERKKIISKLVL